MNKKALIAAIVASIFIVSIVVVSANAAAKKTPKPHTTTTRTLAVSVTGKVTAISSTSITVTPNVSKRTAITAHHPLPAALQKRNKALAVSSAKASAPVTIPVTAETNVIFAPAVAPETASATPSVAEITIGSQVSVHESEATDTVPAYAKTILVLPVGKIVHPIVAVPAR